MWFEIILAALGVVSSVVGYLRGGGAEARKQLSQVTEELALWKHRALIGAERTRHLEKEFVLLKKRHNENLTDDELRMLANGLRGGTDENGVS